MDQTFSISQLNGFIRDVVQSGFPTSIWVTGEIQNYDRAKNRKHVFFELVEKDTTSSDIIAKIGLVIFERTKTTIQQTLQQSENAFDLKDDIEVRFLCRVDFYAPHGAMRLIVEDIDPVYTLGKLAQDKQKLMAALQEEGLVELNKRHTLSSVPLRIGLITAYDSAAYHDFCDELKQSGLGFQIFVADAVMQGKRCEPTVVAAFKQLKQIKGLDVIVLSRGGGSLADLAAFDTRLIAEAIASAPYPVLTGIGHEINTSIADMVAHSSAKTPTAAAQMLIEQVRLFTERLNRARDAIFEGVDDLLHQERQQVKDIAVSLRSRVQDYFQEQKQALFDLSRRIKDAPEGHLADQRGGLKEVEMLLNQSIRLRFERLTSKIDHYSQLVRMVDPVNTLKKGFTISRNDQGKLIRQLADVHQNESITTETTDGQILSVVSSVNKE